MLKIISQKNIMLTQKMEHITKRTTRKVILLSLDNLGDLEEVTLLKFHLIVRNYIDYLSVERSAMSNELSKNAG